MSTSLTMKTVNWLTANKLLKDLRKSGLLFRVDFNKRSNGDTRSMVCRFGVRSELTGGFKGYKSDDKDLLPVYEPFVGYRAIPLEGITIIKHKGITYDFRSLNENKRTPSPKVTNVKTVPVVGWGE